MPFLDAIVKAVHDVVAWVKGEAKKEDDAKAAKNRAEAKAEVTAAEEAERKKRQPK
jgi:hypothetical protein